MMQRVYARDIEPGMHLQTLSTGVSQVQRVYRTQNMVEVQTEDELMAFSPTQQLVIHIESITPAECCEAHGDSFPTMPMLEG